MTRHQVIYDTDPGIDDAMAFVFQALHPDIELVGVTSVFGNATIDTTTRNALLLTERFAADVPVARGAAAPLKRAAPVPLDWIHGADGLGNTTPPALQPDHTKLDARPAHRFIVETVRAQPGEITLLAVGPLTNLALALADDPGIADQVKQVVVMGGAFGIRGVLGNVTPAAEANVYADPEAADIVFGAPWKLSVVGLDVTHETVMTNAYLASIRDRGGEPGRFVWDVSRHYERFHLENDRLEGIYVHDYSAAAFLLAPHLYETRSGPVRVVTDGIATGQTIQKPTSMNVPAPDWDGRPSCTVCTGVDAPAVLALYERALCGD